MSSSTTVGRAATSFGGMFYAHLHDTSHDRAWRLILIVFATRQTADEWWRAISTSNIRKVKESVQRVTPQFFTHQVSKWDCFSFFSDREVSAIASNFRGKMFFILESDGLGKGITPIPQQTIVDHTSGDWFCIRSKRDAKQHWHYESNQIVVSDKFCTPFRITASNLHSGGIMIGSDTVTLAISEYKFVGLRRFADGWNLEVTGHPASAAQFKFEDLDKGRLVITDDQRDPVVSYVPGGSGAGWELVL
ncbi:hypothetical protein BDN72DRAFT_810294 [Pluteus cervinus]|uniref:Uncharacterized protein n=1 Tax=Pluteus cervinus TaxID=181527 RepID=A0ACD3BBS0_9AGAR|nr:hypothetical protein BDN72DRAFT_810294 [Pluteus cervinus]